MKKVFVIALALVLILAVNVSAAVNLINDAVEITTSTFYNDDYSGEATRDGIVRGNDFTLSQWITDYESEADLTLTWTSPVTVNRAVLYDRNSTTDNVASGTITFSDGTVVEFGELEPTGLATEVTFDAVTATSAVIHIISDETTMAVGLDEVEFFTADGVNVALDAKASASSVLPDGTDNENNVASWYPENYTDWYVANKAINGYAKANVPAGAEYEWASAGEPNPTISIGWSSDITIGTIVLYDRINSDDHITAGTITFSDGSTVDFGDVPNDGSPLYIDVADISANEFTINTVTEGPNPGFAEIEVFTEHFENGKPIGEEAQEVEAVIETEAPVTDAAPAIEEAPAVEAPVTTAPQTSDAIIAVMTIMAAAAAVVVTKKVSD